MTFFVIGAGLYGCVVAERLANIYNENVVLIDRRSTLGGNCHADIDEESGIEIHRYGSHIFHTDNARVVDYLRQFTELSAYRHKVRTVTCGRSYSIPVNLSTLNDYLHFPDGITPKDAQKILAFTKKRETLSNFEEYVIALVGESIYRAFYYGYTKKQWGCEPRMLPVSIAQRLPVRTTYDDSYFTDRWQGIPEIGYANLFIALTESSRIEKRLACSYQEISSTFPSDAVVIYTGAPDELFDYEFGALSWRSLVFEFEKIDLPDYQGIAVMNYADESVPYTRIHEFKHYLHTSSPAYQHAKTIICREYPARYVQGKEQYYPVNDEKNNSLYALYAKRAKDSGIHLGGRLGLYKYMDMDITIDSALTFSMSLACGGISCA